MASVTESGRGGRRGMSADINLVPFIDLLSVSICFLLMTAVWVQTGAISVEQATGTEAKAEKGDELAIELLEPNRLRLVVKNEGREKKHLLVSDKELDAALAGLPPVTGASIATKKGVSYGALVATMDVLRRHHISNLGIVP